MAASLDAPSAPVPASVADGDCQSPLTLAQLVERLSRLPAAPAFDELRDWLDRAEIDADSLAPYVNFRPGTYVRTRVLLNEHVEVLVLCWRPGHYTSIHDHNGSYSVIRVLSGRMHETLYDFDGERGLCEGAAHTWEPGHVTTADIPDIHRIGNAESSGRDLVTLHCYSPPFDTIKTYQPGSRQIGELRPEAPREVAVSD